MLMLMLMLMLMYLLGTGYISKRVKFKHVWEDVSTQRTLHEIIEAVHPLIPFEARMEVVITDRTLSILYSFRHEYLSHTRRSPDQGMVFIQSTHHLQLL